MRLTNIQKAALVGAILGDGYLQKTGERNARLRFEHSLKQKEYLEWKTELFPKLFQGKLSFLSRVHPKTRRTYEYVRHQSNSSPVLGRFRKIFYPQDRKRIPEDLADWLVHNIALAIWYFDDGYYYPRDHCAYIYLGRVSQPEAQIANHALKNCFDLNSRVLDKGVKGFVLYFPRKEAEKLTSLVKPFVVPSMTYKLFS